MTEQTVSAQQRPRILVVDDEEAIRMLLMMMLQRGGRWEIEEAADAAAARRELIRQSFDLVITDQSMPGETGLSLMQWAKDRGLDPEWIILTGHGTFDDAIQAVRLGAFDFITKPLDSPDALLLRVRNVLRQRQLEQERRKLNAELQQRNLQLGQQVSQLRDACSLLCAQAENIASDLRRAEIIQRALLPSVPPDLPDFALNAVYRPSNNVGGDLYDMVRLGDRYAVIYLADAAGHGVAAAMLAVLFKESLRLSRGPVKPVPPSEVLALANSCVMSECRKLGLFVTAAYCLLDVQQRTLTVASAGHPPLILHRQDGGLEYVFHTGPALGISSEARFGEKVISLNQGDRLLCYTDGIFNAPDGVPQLRNDDLAQAISRDDHGGQGLLNDLLATAAQRRRGAAQDDDITLILMTAASQPSQLDNGLPPGGGPETVAAPAIPARPASVSIGQDEKGAAISIDGPGRWNGSSAFLEACQSQVQAGRPLTLDLSLCDYLDSTFLGTLEEVAQMCENANVSLRIQGTLPELRRLLEELGMHRVLSHAAGDMQPLPGKMSPLPSASSDTELSRMRILQAHEALAALSDSNRRKFMSLIEALRGEIEVGT